jgi:hypothetical protein
MLCVSVIVITNQDSTSSRLLPGSSYSCCIRNLHALVHKQCHPVHITTAHEILQRRKWQLCKSTLPPNHSGSWARKECGWASSSTGRSCIPKAAHRLQPRANHSVFCSSHTSTVTVDVHLRGLHALCSFICVSRECAAVYEHGTPHNSVQWHAL